MGEAHTLPPDMTGSGCLIVELLRLKFNVPVSKFFKISTRIFEQKEKYTMKHLKFSVKMLHYFFHNQIYDVTKSFFEYYEPS